MGEAVDGVTARIEDSEIRFLKTKDMKNYLTSDDLLTFEFYRIMY